MLANKCMFVQDAWPSGFHMLLCYLIPCLFSESVKCIFTILFDFYTIQITSSSPYLLESKVCVNSLFQQIYLDKKYEFHKYTFRSRIIILTILLDLKNNINFFGYFLYSDQIMSIKVCIKPQRKRHRLCGNFPAKTGT